MCICIWLYKFWITFWLLLDVSYSDKCQTKIAFSMEEMLPLFCTVHLLSLLAIATVYCFSLNLKFITAKCRILCLFSIVSRHLIIDFPIKALKDAEELLAEKSKTRFFRKFPAVSQKLAQTLSDVSLVTTAIYSLDEDGTICMFFNMSFVVILLLAN